MKLSITPLMAALSLIMSALPVTAQSVAATATIKISVLPFTVTAPGTYVLVSDLACAPSSYAITIPTNLTGPVIVDLKGFTITGAGIDVENNYPAVLSSITISNLTITVVAPPPSYCVNPNVS
jgi:hypothetical protein